jgi:hypothetical protein
MSRVLKPKSPGCAESLPSPERVSGSPDRRFLGNRIPPSIPKETVRRASSQHPLPRPLANGGRGDLPKTPKLVRKQQETPTIQSWCCPCGDKLNGRTVLLRGSGATACQALSRTSQGPRWLARWGTVYLLCRGHIVPSSLFLSFGEGRRTDNGVHHLESHQRRGINLGSNETEQGGKKYRLLADLHLCVEVCNGHAVWPSGSLGGRGAMGLTWSVPALLLATAVVAFKNPLVAGRHKLLPVSSSSSTCTCPWAPSSSSSKAGHNTGLLDRQPTPISGGAGQVAAQGS